MGIKDILDEIKTFGTAKGLKEIISFVPFPLITLSTIEFNILSLLKEKKGVDSIQSLVNMYTQEIEEIPRSTIQYHLKNLINNRFIHEKRKGNKAEMTVTKMGDLYISSKML